MQDLGANSTTKLEVFYKPRLRPRRELLALWWSRIVRALPLAATICVFAVTIALGLVASPSSDDYCRASLAASHIPASVLGSYRHWSGRWMEDAFDISAFPARNFHKLYFVYLASLLAAYFASLWWFVTSLLGKTVRPAFRAAICAILLALFIAGMPFVGETIFWATGAVSSVLPVFGIACVVGFLLSPPNLSQPIRYAFLVLACLCVSGLHEVFAGILCIVLAIGTLTTIVTRHPHRSLWVVALLSAIAGAAIVAFAPGNKERALIYFAGSPPATWRQIVFGSSYYLWASVLGGWFLDIKLLGATFLFVCNPAIRKLRPAWCCEFNLQAKVACASGWLLATLFPFFVPQFVNSQAFGLPARAMDGVYATFLLGWFSTVFVFTRTAGAEQEESRVRNLLVLLASVMLAVSLIQAPNTRDMFRDLRSNAPAWRKALITRMDAIRDARAQNRLDLVVPQLPPKPASFFYIDIGENPNVWPNTCTARYYGLRTIRATAEKK